MNESAMNPVMPSRRLLSATSRSAAAIAIAMAIAGSAPASVPRIAARSARALGNAQSPGSKRALAKRSPMLRADPWFARSRAGGC